LAEKLDKFRKLFLKNVNSTKIARILKKKSPNFQNRKFEKKILARKAPGWGGGGVGEKKSRLVFNTN